jgi:spore germination cell wall hydrolase CwlJ-like protein
MDHRLLEMITYGLIILIAGSLTSPAQTQSEIVTATIVLEAGGEYSEGAMHAVHEVIVNRSAKRQLTLAEVCLQPFQFSCWNGAEVADQIIKAKRHPRWREAFAITLQPVTRYTGGADHYHADYCNPYWNKYMKVTAKIGRHIFYK